MGRIVYRVMVEATEYDESGDVTVTHVLFDAASPSATRLYAFVPQQVELALAEAGGPPMPSLPNKWMASFVPTEAVAPTVSATPDGPAVEVPVTAPAEPETAPMDPFPAPPEGKPKRTRRTKAQIAADEAAAALAAQQAAGATVADLAHAAAEPAPQTPDGSTVAAIPPADPAPLSLVPPLPAEHEANDGGTAVAPTSAPAVPYNPFLQN